MKKNVLMRAASGLLVATMLTTCAISGTFAKYVTQDNGGDLARVAKWGVVVQVEGDLYGENYLDTTNTASDDKEDTVSVSSKTNTDLAGTSTANLVAPGTKSSDSPYSFSINGTPEVDSQTTVKIIQQNVYLAKGTYGVMVPVAPNVVTATNFDELIAGTAADDGLFTYDGTAKTYNKVQEGTLWASVSTEKFYTLEDYVVFNEAGMDRYYPVYYTMGGTTTNTSYAEQELNLTAKKENTLEVISDKILTNVGTNTGDWTWDTTNNAWTKTISSGRVDHNTDLKAHFKLEDQTIAWEWEFEDDDSEFGLMEEGTDYGISQQDKLDTILGNLMAERVDDKKGSSDFKGEVVKLTETNKYKAPMSYLDDTADHVGDFCLDTQFNIDILVEQMD